MGACTSEGSSAITSSLVSAANTGASAAQCLHTYATCGQTARNKITFVEADKRVFAIRLGVTN